MGKKDRIKYFIMFFTCFIIFIYGFIQVNINKTELVKDKSEFTIDFKLNPVDFRIDTKGYVFYVNNKSVYNIKEKCIGVEKKIINVKESCIDVFNGVFSKK
ncbi:MAG TPA: hypothetical protein VIM70_09155 [Clostridium sp.]|uniref:hypothetical protein n=1 Tax=Clostridium sp. TaxID=1506 RepID=UPI002F92BBE3